MKIMYALFLVLGSSLFSMNDDMVDEKIDDKDDLKEKTNEEDRMAEDFIAERQNLERPNEYMAARACGYSSQQKIRY